MIQNILSTKSINVFLPMKNVNFFIVKVLVNYKIRVAAKLPLFFFIYEYSFFLLTFEVQK